MYTIWYPKPTTFRVRDDMRVLDVWYGTSRLAHGHLEYRRFVESRIRTHRADSPAQAIPVHVSPPGGARRDR